jgi:gliding motility-associated-like protein
MKKILLLFLLFTTVAAYGQCPATVPLTAKPDNCLGTALTVSQLANTFYNKITWYNGSSVVSVVNGTPGSSTGITVAGGNGPGAAVNQLHSPFGLFVDGVGNLYVVDEDNHRVQKWPPGATAGVTVAGGNGKGSGPHQLDYPMGLAVDAAGNLFIADVQNNRIQKWAPGATSGITVAGGNGPGKAGNQLNFPICVVIDKSGNLFVGDNYNYRVQKWVPGATTGVTVAGGNGAGAAANQFSSVYGLAIDDSGNLYVSDIGNSRVQKWTSGATAGTTVAVGNGYGTSLDKIGEPFGIFVDKQGNIFVGDYFTERVTKWAPGATSGVLIAGGNGRGNGSNQFYQPGIIYIDNAGNLYVADGFNNRVQKWTIPTIEREYIPTVPGSYTAVLETSDGCSIKSDEQIVNPIASPSISISTPNLNINPCTQITFTAQPIDGGTNPSFQWQINGTNTGGNSPTFTSDHLEDGDIVGCILASNAACATNSIATSNLLKLTVNGNPPATVAINTGSNNVCPGDIVHFAAEITNGGTTPVYQWKLNGINVGSGGADFSLGSLKNGDTVSCEVSFNDRCQTTASNRIVMTVYSAPVIARDQIFTIAGGQSLTLKPLISGNIQSYLWSPGTFLSDSTISNPIANPARNTEYLLKVMSTDGCEAFGKILVKASSGLKIPNAFTPNGDGKNDLFNIIGGTAGSIINEFAVYNRWGQVVFNVKNKTPDNNGGGWNGTYQGLPAPVGTYVYTISIVMADGTKQTYHGPVLLIR